MHEVEYNFVLQMRPHPQYLQDISNTFSDHLQPKSQMSFLKPYYTTGSNIGTKS